MPIYEYQCTSCGELHEALQKMSADPLTQCPHCNQPTLKKKLSSATFKLKGTGWYETDFKNKKTSTKTDSPKKETTTHSCKNTSCDC